MPKRCGHFDGHTLVGLSARCRRRSPPRSPRAPTRTSSIVARTDARGVLGLDEALRRGHAYLEAGADALFLEAPRSVEEMERIGREFAGVPLVANIVEGGKTPPLPVAELRGHGLHDRAVRQLPHAGDAARRPGRAGAPRDRGGDATRTPTGCCRGRTGRRCSASASSARSRTPS